MIPAKMMFYFYDAEYSMIGHYLNDIVEKELSLTIPLAD